MPKRQKDTHSAGSRPNAPWLGFPRWLSSGRSVTARTRQALYDVVGEPYDREPCQHVLRTRELVAPPEIPNHRYRVPFLTVGQAKVKTTDRRCVRPAGHVRQEMVGTAPDPRHPGDPHYVITVNVPDEAARLHADAAGNTW
jgi:hypothetical protein